MPRALVCGAGGFIGGFLVKRLLDEGYQVRAIDIKPYAQWHQVHHHQNIASVPSIDLRREDACRTVVGERGIDEVYNLAADMGGMGYIETHKYECMQSVLINTNLLNAALQSGVSKYFYASSACVYPGYLQGTGDHVSMAGFHGYGRLDDDGNPFGGLRESDAYPADPEDGYGWEKLFSERMCRHAYEDRGLEVRVARYHNVYGPLGTWEGGREKAPAAMCRKVAECIRTGNDTLDIWGDGEQLRSYMYIDDCIEGTRKLMESSWTEPLNIGSSEMVSVNELAELVQRIATDTIWLNKAYDLTAPQGVRGRNSDNTLIKQVLRWEPQITLNEGLRKTYDWIYEQVKAGVPAA